MKLVTYITHDDIFLREEKLYFKKEDDDSLKSFVNIARNQGISIIIANYNNVDLNLVVLKGYTLSDNRWVETNNQPIRFIYDRFHPLDTKSKNLKNKLISNIVPVFNNVAFSNKALDKLSSYEMLKSFSIPTESIANNNSNTISRIMEFANSKFNEDFTKGEFIIKPRYGFHGKRINKIRKKCLKNYLMCNEIIEENVIQPFLETKYGIQELNIETRHDVRLILSNNKIVQCYSRHPSNEGFVSNLSCGGSITYHSVENLPFSVLKFANRINNKLNIKDNKFYTIDFGMGRSKTLWIIEINTIPGIKWLANNPIDKQKITELQKEIVNQLTKI